MPPKRTARHISLKAVQDMHGGTAPPPHKANQKSAGGSHHGEGLGGITTNTGRATKREHTPPKGTEQHQTSQGWHAGYRTEGNTRHQIKQHGTQHRRASRQGSAQARGNPPPPTKSKATKRRWKPPRRRPGGGQQKLAEFQTKVIELKQHIDALQISAANATAATDHRVDALQSSTENVTRTAVSDLRRLEHEFSQCYILLIDSAQFSRQQPSNQHPQFQHSQFPPQHAHPQPPSSCYPPYSPSNNQPPQHFPTQ